MNSQAPNPASGGKSNSPSPPFRDTDKNPVDAGAGNAAQPSEQQSDARKPHHISRELAERGIPADNDPDDPVSP